VTTTQRTQLRVPAGEGETLSFLGMDLVWKVKPALASGTLAQFEHYSPPGTGVPLHIHHGEDESLYVLEGELVAQLGEDVFECAAGDMVAMPRGLPHAWRVTGERTARILFTFSLTPASDYETMFARLVGLAPTDFEQIAAVCAANNIEFVSPTAMP
jgi:quercetin dioxygenase-like cupin family protein